ncbi:Uncharacterized protein Rs2_36871 [Raphanus sativus]|uniref:Uncharacterized protein LOC108820800 n=1 Tax=Raphanus sativus TaxID=3726 RepID=A0A6J0KP49_RAPSA|nr:uncharacterized protein LOC108820800 [Raphanus sativus]KAJ4879817.1 Uncharacterized protein Rs2_36871 [Raphanus sativus]
MNIKKKGKVHPSPPPPSSSPSSKGDDCLSVLKLLPAVILLLVSSLSPEDKQVLAYLITPSVKTTAPNTTPAASGRRRSSFSSTKNKTARTHHHKTPRFDCECFDCYTSYWFRWDSSPNRELIHQIIEAYEDHITKSEKSNGGGRKKKEKSRRRGRVVEPSGRTEEPVEPVVITSGEAKPEESPEMSRFPVGTRQHKGLARKVLPDVMGLFNSRFWRLWNPNA